VAKEVEGIRIRLPGRFCEGLENDAPLRKRKKDLLALQWIRPLILEFVG
jgi:hypothetical protein